MREHQAYRPWEHYNRDPRLKRVVDVQSSPLFCTEEPTLFDWIRTRLLSLNDEHVHLADFGPFAEAQARAAQSFVDDDRWTRMSILNVARIGPFSSDRTVQEYARDTWEIRAS